MLSWRQDAAIISEINRDKVGADWVNKTIKENRISRASVISKMVASLYIEIHGDETIRLFLFVRESINKKSHSHTAPSVLCKGTL